MPETLICNATIVDGSGAPPHPGEILVRADTIAGLGPNGRFQRCGRRLIDAGEMIVSPGFIDVHSHADNAALLDYADASKISQGVTTEVVGNCGMSLFPIDPDHSPDTVALLEQTFPRLAWDWRTYAEFSSRVTDRGVVTNQAQLLGHNTLRTSVGANGATLRPQQQEAMRARLTEALNDGATGLSTGLIYAPGAYSSFDELADLLGHLPATAMYASHMRNESYGLLESIEEIIALARQSGARCHVSHLKASGYSNWGKVGDALALLDRARTDGLAIKQDIYPYTASSTMLTALLPPAFREGSPEELLDRLGTPEELERLKGDLESANPNWESPIHESGWSSITIASAASGHVEGHRLDSIARDRETDPVTTLRDLLVENGLRITMIQESMDEADIVSALRNDHTMIGSDGLPPGLGGKPHPRQWGTFPRIIGRYSREKQILPMTEAVRRMTSLPAEWFGITNRGAIRTGMKADLCAFDYESINDTATYDAPESKADGMHWVMVNGTIAYADREVIGLAGQLLKKTYPPHHEG
ncbi:N-acyl-D-amino-acid deacylase family protein [Spelaeicoccus albus]|uniref:N-acyl-D-aspartate/D-glutamate deacylase n=2 Tax=Spelaeicoccus albus TaxID=1280376 RepID=A0A7Z0D4R2_9MICO|nr:N-acyl-D-aspartate/D-glutamate deacylase [Spelaeicoccus albus]